MYINGIRCIMLKNEYRGACIGRLRGSNRTSTLIPDVDNAAVGNALALLQEDTAKGVPCFLLCRKYRRRRYGGILTINTL